jgi:hypothetical protein
LSLLAQRDVLYTKIYIGGVKKWEPRDQRNRRRRMVKISKL